MNKKKPKKIFYFAATHWDREWYKTVDQYRYTLIPVMDKIINTVSKDPDFKLFTLDGQTSVLFDYLVIRGETTYEDTLKSLIRQGRLLIGPWFTMPDEFLISCESMVQNLLYGHSLCEKYQAETLKTGYVCDTFGHVANFPQILNGFNIQSALISRGTNDEYLDSFFDWSSPDGSKVTTFRAPEVCGYGSFFFEVMSEYAPDYKAHLDEITDKAIQYVERELTRTSLPYVLLMDGMDHETIHEFMPEILDRLAVHFECPVVQERLDDVLWEVSSELKSSHKEQSKSINSLSQTGSDSSSINSFDCSSINSSDSGDASKALEAMVALKPTSRTGELTDHCKANIMHNKLIPHTLSSRYDLKSANDQCQNLLEHYAMPCSAIDEMNGFEYLYPFIRHAYTELLQNHAHDSICGCSIDAVHREMHTRFSKAYHTANEYFFQYCAKEYFRSVEAFKNQMADSDPSTALLQSTDAPSETTSVALAAATIKDGSISSSDMNTSQCIVKIFNPLPYEYQGAIEFDIDFDKDFDIKELPYVKFEQRNSFLILDEDNKELKYNIIHATRNKYVKQFGGNKRLADTHRVAVLGKLKPMGFTTFTIKPYELPYRITERFSTSPTSCENELIRFEIASDGTVAITDKNTGKSYSGLHSFLDCGEMGDGWFHIRPIADRSLSSLGSRVSIEKTFDGYAECKFLLRYEFELPKEKEKSYDFVKRSDAYEPLIIRSEFTITRDSKLVSVHTEIENNIKDHRLQLHLPTHTMSGGSYSVNQCNLILSRKTGLDHSHYNWKETDITEYPFENMAFIRSEDRKTPHGLMFLSKGGLHEVSCPGDQENSIDITLLRCFDKTVNTNGEPDGQLQGRQVFDYALLPISDETDSELIRRKDQYVCGYKEFTIPSGAKLISDSAFTFSSDGCTYLTSMPSKKQGSGIIIRAVNNSGEPSSFTLRFAKEVKSAILCNYLEEECGSAKVIGNDVVVDAMPYQMVNVKVGF